MRRAPKQSTKRSRISFRVPVGWREEVRAWCEEHGVPEAELFRRATHEAFGWCPGSPADDTYRPGRPPAASERPPSNLTWDMTPEDLERFRHHAASFGIEPGRALLLLVDAFIGRPWEIKRRFEALEAASRLIARPDLVRSLGPFRRRLEAK